MMKLRFPESEIVSWAGRYYYPHEESDLMQLKQKIQNQGHLNKEQLRLVVQWKAPRSARHMEKNSPEYVREVTSWSFSAIEERGKIESLTLLNGVLWPSASVILHLFHKDPYPILDFRALWSVSSDVPKQYSFDFWWKYNVFCRAIVKKNSIDMRTLDRALWQYSKENQKT